MIKKSKGICKKQIKKTVNDGIDELSKLARLAKNKYDSTDDATKKKVLAGVAGAAALLAGAMGLKKALKKKDK